MRFYEGAPVFAVEVGQGDYETTSCGRTGKA
jgi:hypothetical protein